MKTRKLISLILAVVLLFPLLPGTRSIQANTQITSELSTTVVFPDGLSANITDLNPVEMTAIVPQSVQDGDTIVQTPDGDSNGAPFQVGDSSTPDETGIGTAWSTTFSGPIASNTVWSQNVLVTGDVIVNSGVTLTIEPDVTVFFAANSDDQASGRWTDKAELSVWGVLIAEGDETSPIYFTSAATQTLPGDWGGITVRKNSTNSSLKYCLIQYAENGVSFYSHSEGGGTLSGTVANCTLQHNEEGVTMYGRPESISGGAVTMSPTIANNLIVSNTRGVEINTTTGYGTTRNYATVQNNTIRGNETGAHIRTHTWWSGHADNYPNIVNNTFRDNTAYGIDIEAFGSSDSSGSDTDARPTIENNLFDTVTITATTHIRLYLDPQGSDGAQILSPTIRYNTIRNAAYGILVDEEQPYDTINPTISHNVFYGFDPGNYAIRNLTGRTITAAHNYWGTTEPEWDAGAPPAIIAGTVVVSDHLTRHSPPVLTRLEPAAAQPDGWVTLHGANLGFAPQPILLFHDNQPAYPNIPSPVEMMAAVPQDVQDGDVIAQMLDGDSNGAPFLVGDSSTPDETGIGTAWSATFSGQIASDTVWSQNVFVTGDVTVNSGVTLTIEPGVTIFFAPNSDDQASGRWTDKAEFSVWGVLITEGTKTSPIYFTSAAPAPIPGDWGGIVVRKNSTDSSLQHCLVQYAETGVSFYSHNEGGGTLSGTVANCTLQRNGDGVAMYGRPESTSGGAVTMSPSIANNLIVSNTRGVDINTTTGLGTTRNYATVQNNTIRGNETGAHIRAHTWWLGHADNYPNIVNNTFRDNTTYGIDVEAFGSSDSSGSDTDARPTIENNLFDTVAITATTHIRLYLDPQGSDGAQILSPTIRYNTIRNAACGILVDDEQAYDTINPTISHNVFYGFDPGAYAINNLTGRTITATCNYWGTTEPEWDAGAPPAIINGAVVVSDHLTSLSPPVLTRLEPAAAQPDDWVTLHGANFIDESPPLAPVPISLANGSVISDTTPAFDWEASLSPDVLGYQLNLNGTVIDVGSPTEYVSDVLTDGVYLWTVGAYDFAQNTGFYTDTWSFTLDTISPTVPVLEGPADGTLTNTAQLTLAWNAVADAAGYLVDFNGLVSDVGDVTQYATGVLADGAYTWTVAAYDAAGHTSVYADDWTFEINTTVPSVEAVNPPDGVIDVLRNAPIVVDFSDEMLVSTVAALITPSVTGIAETWSEDGSRLSLTHDEFLPNTRYTVTVTGSNLAGTPLAASYTWSFTTQHKCYIYLPLVVRNFP